MMVHMLVMNLFRFSIKMMIKTLIMLSKMDFDEISDSNNHYTFKYNNKKAEMNPIKVIKVMGQIKTNGASI